MIPYTGTKKRKRSTHYYTTANHITVTQKFSLATKFLGQTTPTKIKPTKMCTHDACWATLTHKNLSPQKIYPRNFVTIKIFMFTVFSSFVYKIVYK